MNIEERLKHLKNSMSRTTFKDLDVDKNKLKSKILKKSEDKSNFFNIFKLQHWLRSGLSIAGIILLCLFIGLAGYSSHFLENPHSSGGSGNGESGQVPTLTEKEPLNKSEDYKDKFSIVKKMYHSLNYINNAEGEFQWGHPDNGDAEQVKFYVNYEKEKKYEKVRLLDHNQLLETQTNLYKDQVNISKLNQSHIYTKNSLPSNSDLNKPKYLYGITTFITNSEWYSILYENYRNWEYKEIKTYGISAYEIEGTIPKTKSNFLSGRFTMEVSKETGALLNLHCYGNTDHVIFYVESKDIHINEGVPNKVFQVDVSDSQEVTRNEFLASSLRSKQESEDNEFGK